jgi:hypothetical protein
MKIGRAADGWVQVFARVPIDRQDEQETYRRCELLSATFLLVHALSALVEFEQPDGWTVEESPVWHNALVAFGTAAGTDTPVWIPCNEYGEPLGSCA